MAQNRALSADLAAFGGKSLDITGTASMDAVAQSVESVCNRAAERFVGVDGRRKPDEGGRAPALHRKRAHAGIANTASAIGYLEAPMACLRTGGTGSTMSELVSLCPGAEGSRQHKVLKTRPFDRSCGPSPSPEPRRGEAVPGKDGSPSMNSFEALVLGPGRRARRRRNSNAISDRADPLAAERAGEAEGAGGLEIELALTAAGCATLVTFSDARNAGNPGKQVRSRMDSTTNHSQTSRGGVSWSPPPVWLLQPSQTHRRRPSQSRSADNSMRTVTARQINGEPLVRG